MKKLFMILSIIAMSEHSFSQDDLSGSIERIISQKESMAEKSDSSTSRTIQNEVTRIRSTMKDIEEWRNKKSFSGRAIIGFDGAPAKTWYKLGDGTYTLLVNNDLHQSFKVALSVDLNRD